MFRFSETIMAVFVVESPETVRIISDHGTARVPHPLALIVWKRFSLTTMIK